MHRPRVSLWLVALGLGCHPLPSADLILTERSVAPVMVVETEAEPAPPEPRAVQPGPILPRATGPFDPELNQIYELARFDRWIIAGSQGGVFVWDSALGYPVAAHAEFICSSVVHSPMGMLALGSTAYPGRDPRRLRVDELGRLWVEDFEDGLLRWDGVKFTIEAGITEKGTGVAVDVARDRLWMLHYTRGPVAKLSSASLTAIDLSSLNHMRDMLLDADGTLWVAGWPGLARIDGDAITDPPEVFQL